MSLMENVIAYQMANRTDKFVAIPKDSPLWSTWAAPYESEVVEYSDGKGNIGFRLYEYNEDMVRCSNYGYDVDSSFDWQLMWRPI